MIVVTFNGEGFNCILLIKKELLLSKSNCVILLDLLRDLGRFRIVGVIADTKVQKHGLQVRLVVDVK